MSKKIKMMSLFDLMILYVGANDSFFESSFQEGFGDMCDSDNSYSSAVAQRVTAPQCLNQGPNPAPNVDFLGENFFRHRFDWSFLTSAASRLIGCAIGDPIAKNDIRANSNCLHHQNRKHGSRVKTPSRRHLLGKAWHSAGRIDSVPATIPWSWNIDQVPFPSVASRSLR